MIAIEGLSKIYAGTGRPALKDLSLHVPKGAIYGILGRSGAGKSTLIRCLNLLERPTAGRIIVDGCDITRLDNAGLRAHRLRTGMIFQHFNLLHARTVAQNIAVPLEIAGVPKAQRQSRIEELLWLVGLSDKAHAYPSQLSGGQKQRVGIARALATRPQVLLCDEATSALDPHTTASVLSLLADINQKLNPFFTGTRHVRTNKRLNKGAHGNRLCLQFHFAGFDTREIKNVVNDVQQRLGRTHHQRKVITLIGVKRGIKAQLRHANNAVHRRANFMTHIG